MCRAKINPNLKPLFVHNEVCANNCHNSKRFARIINMTKKRLFKKTGCNIHGTYMIDTWYMDIIYNIHDTWI